MTNRKAIAWLTALVAGAGGASASLLSLNDNFRTPGCCPGCQNGGIFGPDGLPVGGTTLGSASIPAPSAPSAPTPSATSSAPVAPAAVVPPPAALPAAKPATLFIAGADGVIAVDFARLADFAYTPPREGEAPMAGLPDAVRALDGRRVRISGYLLPFEMDNGRCRHFLILRSQMACCYGTTPLPTEWIVGMSAKGVRALQDEPLSFTGTLRVGACYEGGVFTGVFKLEVENEPAS